MVIKENLDVNDKWTYKENSLNFMFIYRKYANILGQ